MAQKRKLKLSDELRNAIEHGPITRYRLGKLTGIDQATLCKFAQGKLGLSMRGIDRVAEVLDLHLTTGTVDKPSKAKGR
ncbi:MAG: hypothetical protein ACYC35_18295 [Pirellulales bacterium]